MSPPQTDSQETKRLLDGAARGDREAFDRLFDMHRSSLRRLVSLRMDARLSARLDHSDIVQDTQMVAFRRFDDYLRRRPMPFRLWLRKTAQQQVYDAQRNHIERHRRSLLREEGVLNRSSIMIAQVAIRSGFAVGRVARREMQRRVVSAVASLDEKNREIVLMRNVEGLSFEDIAQVLDMEAPTVRSATAGR